MARPVIGVIGNYYNLENRFSVQLAGQNNLRAVADVADALPLIFAGNNDRVGAVRTRTGADVLREAAAILGPLCGIETKKEVGRG